jgi:hypothetical protein
MAHNFEFVARLSRLRAPLLAALVFAFVACDTNETLGPDSTTPTTDGVEATALGEPSLATVRFAGGIPIGLAAQPISAFGSAFNGAKLTISPGELVNYLRAIKARGGKVVLMFAGTDHHYKDRRGFNMTKWKARIDRFKNINFSSYITDGTVIGHFLVDEPNDPKNWNGKTISPATVDEMARYSKQRWPKMATIVRAEPSYFKSRHPRILDAAWAQYVTRKGNVGDYIRRNVADAQRVGLALVVGLNISKGGPNRRRLTPNEVKTFGSALLSSSYPCAFVSWEYGSYVTSGSMMDAMRTLRARAQSRSSKNCHS